MLWPICITDSQPHATDDRTWLTSPSSTSLSPFSPGRRYEQVKTLLTPVVDQKSGFDNIPSVKEVIRSCKVACIPPWSAPVGLQNLGVTVISQTRRALVELSCSAEMMSSSPPERSGAMKFYMT